MKRLKSYWVNALKCSWNWLAEKVQHHPWRMLNMLLIISLLLGIVGNILPWHINQHWESLITIQAGSGTFVFALMIFIANRPSDRPEQPYVLLYTSGIIALVILVLLGFMISLLGLTVDSTLLYYFASWLLVMTIAWIAYAVYQLLECLLNESLYYDLLGKALCYDLENNRSIRTKTDQLVNISTKAIYNSELGRFDQLMKTYHDCFATLLRQDDNKHNQISCLSQSFSAVCERDQG